MLLEVLRKVFFVRRCRHILLVHTFISAIRLPWWRVPWPTIPCNPSCGTSADAATTYAIRRRFLQ